MVTPADLRKAFEARLKDGIPNPPGEFHPLDLERANDDKYLQRIIDHVDKDPKKACDLLWDLCIWRKKFGANELNENTIRMDYLREGMFFPRGRDLDGCLLMIIKAKLHVKGQKDFEDVKRIIIYWLDRLEREENGKQITLVFDMDGCGLANMDMELIKYIISVFTSYYPFFLNNIIVFQMPWVLSAAFRVVKTLLPAKAIEILKTVTKDNLKDFVHPDQALAAWGGNDPYVFEFVPEKILSDHTPKKVTFAEQGDSQHSPGEMLHLSPNDTILFKNDNDDISGQFMITNMDESAISFKIRTTSPEKFRVRPSSGTLPSGASQVVLIVVQPGFHLRTVTKDRFLVMSVQIPKTDISQKELSEVWQNSTGSKVDEYRLKCQFPEKDLSKNGTVLDGKSAEKQDSVTNALNNLQYNYEMLHRDVRKLKIFQFLTLFMTALAVLLGYLVYINSATNAYCERM